MTCCGGSCRCGKFAIANNPTLDECAAAVQCSTTEYCDQHLGKCLPLDPGNEKCGGAAFSPYQVDYYLQYGGFDNVCETCNSNKSYVNHVNGSCQATNDLACGKKGTKCRKGQTCRSGKCHCDDSLLYSFFEWNPFIDQDPDRDNKADSAAKPASGCADVLVSSSVLGFLDRSLQTLYRFTDCIKISQGNNITEITPKDFKNSTFRALVCPGGAGKCPAAFCEELFRNFTGSDRGSFCGAAASSAEQAKRCSQNMMLSGETSGDLECANTYMRTVVFSSRTTLGAIDMFNFLGCDGDKDDFVYKLNPSERISFPYRVQTAVKLLGAASHTSLSLLVAILVSIVGVFAVLQ